MGKNYFTQKFASKGEILQEYKGEELAGLEYETCFPELPLQKGVDGIVLHGHLLQSLIPEFFGDPLLIEHLKMLRMGIPVDVPQYDFTVHNRRSETLRIEPRPIIIVEGILTFANDELCSLFDMKVFVDANDDYRFARRIVRDVQYRGRHIEDVVEQYAETVRPMYDKYVEPTKRKADIIVVGGGENKVALELISLKIRDHIAEFPCL